MRLRVFGNALDGIGVMASTDFGDEEMAFEFALVVVSHPCIAKVASESAVISASLEHRFIMSTYLYVQQDATEHPRLPSLYKDCDVDITDALRLRPRTGGQHSRWHLLQGAHEI